MSFFRRKRLFIILVGFIVLVGLIGFSLRDRQELSSFEQFLNDTVGWMQSVIQVPVQFTTGIIMNIDDIRNVYNENQVLKSRLDEYKNLVYEVQELRQDNDELRSILDKTESITDFQPIQASIIARSPEQWFQQIRINRGKQDGVETNMAVITGKGMVGKILSASPFSSTVLLLSGFDRSNRISVYVNSQEQEEDISGFIVGYDEEEEQLLLELNQYDTELETGELVVSSGLGGVFPKGLEIGEIEKITPDKYGLTQMAYVKPSADLYDINQVIVVKRLAAQPDDLNVQVQEGEE